MNAIIPEEKLELVFDTLPVLPDEGQGESLKPTFEFGTHKDLIRFMLDEARLKNYPYPLIFAETPIKFIGNEQKGTVRIVLVLATKTESKFTNRERLEKTIKYRLKPLLKYVWIALNESGITSIINKGGKPYSTEVFYNYGTKDDEKHQAPDIWDAIRFECELEINNGCIRTINYNV